MAFDGKITSENGWRAFFISADIPVAEAELYASKMSENRITRPSDLTKEILKDLEITTIGDILNILRKSKNNDEPQGRAPNNSFKAKIDPPRIKSEMTKAEYRKLRHDWGVFKSMSQIPDTQIAAQIYSTCDSTVQTSIIAYFPNFFEFHEDQILDEIENIVTKSSNPAVHRFTFSNMSQSDGESIQQYIIRLKSAALDCAYACPNCECDLSSIHIKDQLIKGLKNSQLQADILAKSTDLKSLEDIIKHAQAHESAIRDQSSLTDTSEVMRVSEYQRRKGPSISPRHPSGVLPTKPVTSAGAARGAHQRYGPPRGTFQRPTYKKSYPCKGCGSTEHSNSEREKKCPAWGKSCNHCHLPNHFEKVCFRNRQSEIQEIADDEEIVAHVELLGEIYTSVSSMDEEITAKVITIVNGKENEPIHIEIFPDSGASICLAGSHHLSNLKRQAHELTPCKKRVRAVGGAILTCQGYLITTFQIGSKTTTQNLYICDKIDRVYFSKNACKEIGILPQSFPHPMTEKVQAINTTNHQAMPCSATKANIHKLKDHLISSFPTVFEKPKPFPEMKCKPVHIHLKENAKPHAIHTPIPVPIHWREEVKSSLDKDVENGVLEKVPVGEAVEWCSLMVVVAKKDGRPRRTVDLQELNSQCSRETHHCMSPFKLACQIPKGKLKTVLDATDGYHSIPLDQESRPLTTFITEWGRYRYKRLPQGYVAAGDAYTRRYDEIIKDVKCKIKCVDDTLLWSDDIDQAYRDTWNYLKICHDNGITLNKEKFQFSSEEVTFAGLNITMDGICPTKTTLKAIKDFPKPKDITGARSWFGLINTVAWTYSMQSTMQPFRNLVKPNSKFYWDEQLDKLFEASKQIIIAKVMTGIRTFDLEKKTCLQTDWSRGGIGYLLLQQHC